MSTTDFARPPSQPGTGARVLVCDRQSRLHRVAGPLGWDYIALDLQHGLIGYDGMLAGLTAIDAAGSPAGVVARVPEHGRRGV